MNGNENPKSMSFGVRQSWGPSLDPNLFVAFSFSMNIKLPVC